MFEPFDERELRHHFDCGDPDLNDFYRNDLILAEKELITKTYTLKPEEDTNSESFSPVAFVSFCNDAIQKRSFHTKDAREALEHVPERKRYGALPAVKIARLGVHLDFQGRGVGSFLLNVVKCLFRCSNRTGCRFLTVDAYNKERTLSFYTANEFKLISDKDANREQRTLFFDLKRTPDQEVADFALGLEIRTAL